MKPNGKAPHPPLDEEFIEAAERIRELQLENTRLTKQLLKARLGHEKHIVTQQENQELQSKIDLLEHVSDRKIHIPEWVVRTPGKGALHHCMPTLLLSDAHWDEIVRPEEVEGVNKYNREIAVQRLKRTLDRVILVTRDYFRGLKYDGFVLMLGGDCLSGAIHDELIETNEDTVYGSLDFWAEQLAAFVAGLASEFSKLHVVGCVGNHGRRTHKPRMKLRIRDNLDWLLYRTVARATKGSVTWDIPESADVDVQIYDTHFRLTHGDQAKGGGGIAGMMSPLLLNLHRKAQRQMALEKPFRWLVMGHWHDYLHGKSLIVNGSLKGYDEYAYINNFSPQTPIQAFWLTTPEHGPAFPAPIFCADRAAEGW